MSDSQPHEPPSDPCPAAEASSARAQGDFAAIDVTRDCVAATGVSEELVRVLEEYLAKLKAGEAPDRQRLLANHPEFGPQLEACLAGLELMHRGEGDAPPRHLGGFRVLAEIGRGGMGAVYEAEEIALGRRVALKVLRCGALLEASAAERFQREAATIAGLHHTNIVPLFSVGSEHGIHYFAMQLIDGRSLADVVQSGLAEPRRAAGWALQAAEALDHAHRRGVIHRDVKPSNLLIDADERVWLTDFGLARRLDDATMSVSGALLGTPRYMSPEQAGAGRLPIDERTDIYSLGATLYELICGRPVFEGGSPHAVIHDILARDPEPLREVSAGVSRDLDTIVMKCLEKSPARRYASARELADDLRAYLEGRAIRARRPSFAEQAARWLKQQRRGALLTAASAAATLVVLALGLLAAHVYHRGQLGFVGFGTPRPPLVAELTNADGSAATSPLTVPTQQPLELPAGDYQLRVTGDGWLDATMKLDVPRGSHQKFELDLDDKTLWPSQDVERHFVLTPRTGGHELLMFHASGFEWRDGRYAQAGRSYPSPASLIKDLPGFEWPCAKQTGYREQSGVGSYYRPQTLRVPADLDGDGTDDYVLAGRHQAWLAAYLSKGGIWFAGRGSDLEDAADPTNRWRRGVVSSALGRPEVAGDLNGDGAPDLLATFADRGPATDAAQLTRWVEAISGADGKTIWRCDLDPRWFDVENANQIPDRFRWFGRGTGSHPAFTGSMRQSHGVVSRWREHRPRDGDFAYAPQPARLVRLGQKATAGIIAGKHALLLDLASGKPAIEPVELAARPVAPVSWIDVDQDGTPEVVALGETVGQDPNGSIAAEIVVCSLASGKAVWRESLEALFPPGVDEEFDAPAWPVVADLDGDGNFEVLAPNGSSAARQSLDDQPHQATPWGELEARDAATGRLRWTTRIMTMDQQADYFLVGPDIDADGAREVFVASLWGERYDLYVEALSGRDGRTLWRSRQSRDPGNASAEVHVSRLVWWAEGRDGWPRLLIALAHDRKSGTSLIALSAGTGELLTRGHGIHEFQLADINGDRADDLLSYHPDYPQQPDLGGKLTAFSGAPEEAWRSLGAPPVASGDFNGDGLRDLVRIALNGTVSALDGGTGKTLWSRHIGTAMPGSLQVRVPDGDDGRIHLGEPGQSADLDGDGVPDILAHVEPGVSYGRPPKPLSAFSGRDGRLLWRADLDARIITGMPLLAVHDLAGDAQPEVVMAAGIVWGDAPTNLPGFDSQLWLIVLSGRTGKVRWKQPLTPAAYVYGQGNHPYTGKILPALADLNHDDVLDILVPAAATSDGQHLLMRAVDGVSGKTLWEHALPSPLDYRLSHLPPPLIADLDRDGAPEAYVLEVERPAGLAIAGYVARLDVLDATNGRKRWSWETSVPFNYAAYDDRFDRPRPRLTRRVGGSDLVCLNLWGDPGQAVALESVGNVGFPVAQLAVKTPIGRFHLTPYDVDGDGDDEWIVINDGRLQAIKPATGLPLWQSDLDQSDALSGEVLGVWDGRQRRPAIMVRANSPMCKLFRFNGATGAREWLSGLALPKQGRAWLNCDDLALLDIEASDQPMVFLRWGETSVGSRLTPISEHDSAATRSRGPARLSAVPRDPRLARPLPWTTRYFSPPLKLLSNGFQCLALLALPGVLAWRLARKRRFGLRTLALLPVLAALATTALLVDDEPIRGKFSDAVWALPAVVGLAAALRWLVAWRLRPIMGWLLVSVLVATALAVSFMIPDRTSWTEGQYYVPAGWYWIWPIGLYLTSVLFCLGWTLAAVGNAAWRAIRRRRVEAVKWRRLRDSGTSS